MNRWISQQKYLAKELFIGPKPMLSISRSSARNSIMCQVEEKRHRSYQKLLAYATKPIFLRGTLGTQQISSESSGGTSCKSLNYVHGGGRAGGACIVHKSCSDQVQILGTHEVDTTNPECRENLFQVHRLYQKFGLGERIIN